MVMGEEASEQLVWDCVGLCLRDSLSIRKMCNRARWNQEVPFSFKCLVGCAWLFLSHSLSPRQAMVCSPCHNTWSLGEVSVASE